MSEKYRGEWLGLKAGMRLKCAKRKQRNVESKHMSLGGEGGKVLRISNLATFQRKWADGAGLM